ncbi:AAA family ATPase [Streptomyces sp. NPDC002928]|uniref:AAA family ATPase n=1 Tax=Streptomyces sp. NPDC002928 TaxID=3154440 RepID=UPI0033A16C6C
MTDPAEPATEAQGPPADPVTGAHPERSVVISVSSFHRSAAATADEELPADAPSGFRPLPFAHQHTGAVAAALSQLGHQLHGGSVITDPALTETETVLAQALRDTPTSGVLVVHVLTHGHTDGQGGLYLAMSDSRPYDGLDVEVWLRTVERRPDQPSVLVLLDVCHAGTAVDWQWAAWRTRLRAERRKAWVLAASAPDEKAYQGRFSQAVAAVLRRIRVNGLGADPAVEFVPVSLIAREIRRTLEALWRTEHGRPQHLDGTPLGLGEEPTLRLFRNPRYRSTPLARLRIQTEDSLRGFLAELDPVLDAHHYMGRAFRKQRAVEQWVCLFTGRQEELNHLTPWVDGVADRDLALHVVTGTAGSGKSALLGMLVCAAHPDLRPLLIGRLPPLRLPGRGASFAAVHARGRSPAEMAISLATQLGLGERAGGWTASAVVAALQQRVSNGGPPAVIVVDALDESAHVPDTVALLLLPLARARSVDRGRRRGGLPVCRLLVGTRQVDEAAGVLVEAHEHGRVLDLDTAAADELRTDVAAYVCRCLELDPQYDAGEQRELREQLGRRIAETLVSEGHGPSGAPHAGPGDGDSQRSGLPGPYLLASLYLHHLLTQDALNLSQMDDMAAELPRTVSELLALHLRQLDNAWAGPVLTTLAHAKHPGLPADLIQALAPLMDGAPATELGLATVDDVLTDIAFYLRRSVDSDGTTLYRLFHQELVDHLKAAPVSAPAVYHRLLATLRPVDSALVDWDLALPYHLRHLIEHAAEAGLRGELLADPEFLARADSATLAPHLEAADSDQARELAGVYGMSAARHAMADPTARRSIMSIDAARSQNFALARRIARSSEATPAVWTPAWFSGRAAHPLLGTVLTTRHTVAALAVGEIAGRPVVLSTDGTTLRLWDLSTSQPLGLPMSGHTRPVRAVAIGRLADRTHGLSGAADAAVRLWDLEEQRPYGPVLRGHHGTVTGVAFVSIDGTQLVLSSSTDGTMRLWDPQHGLPSGPAITTGQAPIRALAVLASPDGPMAVTAGDDGAVRLWDLQSPTRPVATLPGAPARIRSLSAAPFDRGRALVLAAGDDHTFLWNVAISGSSSQPVASPVPEADPPSLLPPSTGPVGILRGDGHHPITAVTPRHDNLGLRILPEGQERVLGGHTRDITALATGVAGRGRRRIVLTGSQDATIRCWYPDSPIPRPEHGHPDLVTALANGNIVGRRLTAVAVGDQICLRDLTTGRAIRRIDTPHGRVTGVAFARLARRPVLVSVGTDRAVRITAANGEQIMPPLIGHTGSIAALSVGRLDGSPVVVTGGVDNSIAVWDLTGRSLVGRHETAHDAPVTGVALAELSDHSAVVVSCGDDRTVRFWHLTPEGLFLRSVVRHDGAVHAVAVRPSVAGHIAVTAGSDRTIRLWDMADGSPLGSPIVGHTAAVIGIDVGRCHGVPAAFSLGADATLRAWDLLGRRPLALLELPEAGEALAWAPGEGLVISLGRDVLLLRESLL